MPYQIIDYGTDPATGHAIFRVKSWPTEQDRIDGTRERIEDHEFGANYLAPVHERAIKDADGKLKLTTGEFMAEADMFEPVEVKVTHPTKGETVRTAMVRKEGIELAKEQFDGEPHVALTQRLDRHYAELYSQVSMIPKQTDKSDPHGIFAHPEMVKLLAGVAVVKDGVR